MCVCVCVCVCVIHIQDSLVEENENSQEQPRSSHFGHRRHALASRHAPDPYKLPVHPPPSTKTEYYDVSVSHMYVHVPI